MTRTHSNGFNNSAYHIAILLLLTPPLLSFGLARYVPKGSI